MLIGGSLRGAVSGAAYRTRNPTTEQLRPACADADDRDVELAVAAARHAFDDTTWSNDHEQRRECLVQIGDALLRHATEFRHLLVDEIGIPVANLDVRWEHPLRFLDFCVDAIDWITAEHELAPHNERASNVHRLVIRTPRGVVAAIPAYNSPIQMCLSKVAPAIATGCSVVVKMPPQAPTIGALLCELLASETDLPPGAVNVLTSSGVRAGAALVESRGVDMVTFTGSRAVGLDVVAGSATTIKKVILELGGKSANIVLDDVDDVELVVRAAVHRCSRHAGQGCAVPSRLLVPRAHLQTAIDAARDAAVALVWGDPWLDETEMGPLISDAQRNRVLGFVRRAVAGGAQLIAGGCAPPRSGYFVLPTVVAGIDSTDEIAREEVFGPVLVVQAHDGDIDAASIANDSMYGLSGTVWSSSLDRALGVARAVRVGVFSVNGADPVSPATPFGGLKQSGIGKEMGRSGLAEFLDERIIAY